jgi:hypothetical protein
LPRSFQLRRLWLSLLRGDVFKSARSRLRRLRRRSRGRLGLRCRWRLGLRCGRRGLRRRLLLRRLCAQLRLARGAKIYRHHGGTDEPEDPHARYLSTLRSRRWRALQLRASPSASLPIRLTHRNYSTRQNHDRRQLSQHFSGSSRRATTSVAGYRCDVWAQFSTVRGGF